MTETPVVADPALAQKRLAQLFATPVLEYEWPESAALNERLRTVILAQEQKDGGEVRSNAGGWHSKGDLDRWAGPAGQELIGRVGAQINQATGLYYKQTNGKDAIRWRLTLWANVNRNGQFNRVHIHPGCTWSGVYYVDPGDAPADGMADSGAFVLQHPNLGAVMSFFPDLTPQSFAVQPRPGLCLVFPSYLPHEVYPYRGQRPRISVAFNARREAA